LNVFGNTTEALLLKRGIATSTLTANSYQQLNASINNNYNQLNASIDLLRAETNACMDRPAQHLHGPASH
jgi:hypothetical protein